MSRTRKDTKLARKKRILELVAREDGTFSLYCDAKAIDDHIPERWLPEELCVRCGVCNEEYESIVRTAKQEGKATFYF